MGSFVVGGEFDSGWGRSIPTRFRDGVSAVWCGTSRTRWHDQGVTMPPFTLRVSPAT